MSDPQSVSLALFVLRITVGLVMAAHGYNHVFGGGKIAGTAKWFGGLGMRPPRMHAWLASLTELGAGVLLVLGLLTPFAAAGVIGTMTVAWVINHRSNGFFIFRPGEGYEYVMTLVACGLAIGVLGPGTWSLDDAVGLVDDLTGAPGLVISAGAGFGGALLLLLVGWRPAPRDR